MQSTTAHRSQTQTDLETTALWVDVADALGFPRSVGETYAQVFLSAEPVNADELVERLGISRSGAGQALKTLVEVGAIRPARGVPGRKDHFELQTDLGVLARLFLGRRILPRLEEYSRRRAALAESARRSGIAHLAARHDRLERWGGKTRPLLAVVRKLIED
jgi:DNA-binding transcriptional regulator GbsR (MarR family)